MLQRIISKRFSEFAPFGARELNGKKPGVLYSRKGKIDCTFDFYYIKSGLVRSVNYYYYNNRIHRQQLKEIINIGDTKNRTTPREYLLMAEYFQLKPDHDTYCDVVKEWMSYKGHSFYEDII